MTTIAAVKAVWLSEVFEHTDILAITDKILNYEITQDSEVELSVGYYQTEINFFEYLISKSERIVEVGGQSSPQYQFDVDVRYTLEQKPGGANYIAVNAAIETLCTVVRTELGATWSTLEVKTANEILPTEITSETINNTKCFRKVVRFTAYKQ